MSDDGLSSKCGSLTITYKSSNPLTYNISYASTTASDLLFNFDFVSETGGFQVKDGKAFFDPLDPENGHVQSGLVPRAVTSGTMLVDGKAYSAVGHGALVRALQYKPSSAARWNFVNFHGSSHGASLILYQVRPSL